MANRRTPIAGGLGHCTQNNSLSFHVRLGVILCLTVEGKRRTQRDRSQGVDGERCLASSGAVHGSNNTL